MDQDDLRVALKEITSALDNLYLLALADEDRGEPDLKTLQKRLARHLRRLKWVQTRGCRGIESQN